jgi:hypothetical protein
MAATRDAPDPILPLVRRSVWVLLVLAGANGVYLYLLPGQAATNYAWPVKPAATAAFMGAGYLAGLVAAYLAIFRARHWRSVYALVPAFIGLSVLLLAATLVHADRFRWSFPLTWMWTAVYAAIPIAATVLWRMQSQTSRDDPARDPRTRTLRGLAVAAGGILTAIALVLFVAPDGLLDRWPWTLTDLTARVLGGWYALSATMLLIMGVGLRRRHETVVPFATVGTWTALVMLLPAFHAEIDTRSGPFWAWFVLHAALLALCISALLTARQVLLRPSEASV